MVSPTHAAKAMSTVDNDPDGPMTLADAIEYVCGRYVLCLVCERLGGQRLYMPQREDRIADHPVAKIVGVDDYKEILDLTALAGEYAEVPQLLSFRRHVQIEQLLREEKSLSQISEIVGLQMRQVSRIKRNVVRGNFPALPKRKDVIGPRPANFPKAHNSVPEKTWAMVERLTKVGFSAAMIGTRLGRPMSYAQRARRMLRDMNLLPEAPRKS